MAIILQTKLFFIFTMSILLSIPCQAADECDDFLVELDHKPIKEKLSHFRVYWHDIQSGSAPTSIEVVKPAPNASFAFGKVNMIDNPLTIGPELSSKTVGNAQGFYAMVSQENLAALMAMNFVFTEGKYNGSTITILGRNAIFNHVREIPVIGGSGIFRFARGYAQARTHTFDQKSGDATVQYDVYVKHY